MSAFGLPPSPPPCADVLYVWPLSRVINTRIVEHDWKSGWHRLCATERGRLALGTLFSRAHLPQAKVFTPECCKVPEIPQRTI